MDSPSPILRAVPFMRYGLRLPQYAIIPGLA